MGPSGPLESDVGNDPAEQELRDQQAQVRLNNTRIMQQRLAALRRMSGFTDTSSSTSSGQQPSKLGGNTSLLGGL